MFIDNEESNDLENELVVTEGVPETPQEEQIETDASNEVDEVQETTQEVVQPSAEDIERMIEERANKKKEEEIETRLIRDRISRERKEAPMKAKYEELETIMKTALGAKDIDDVIAKSKEFYREQGIQIPEIINKTSLNERDEIILAKADAVDIIKLGKTEMEAEANRIAAIPKNERSVRDNTVFNEVCSKLMIMKDEENLKSKGYDMKILDDKDFSLFRKQFTLDTPVAKVYEIYSKLNQKSIEKPASAGSAKSENNNSGETFSVERINNMTPEEMLKNWNNPAFRKIAGLN